MLGNFTVHSVFPKVRHCVLASRKKLLLHLQTHLKYSIAGKKLSPNAFIKESSNFVFTNPKNYSLYFKRFFTGNETFWFISKLLRGFPSVWPRCLIYNNSPQVWERKFYICLHSNCAPFHEFSFPIFYLVTKFAGRSCQSRLQQSGARIRTVLCQAGGAKNCLLQKQNLFDFINYVD